MDLLILLVESRGQLVSRSDIVDRLWGKDVFVDVETGVNTAISKVRQALRDSPDAPVFVETVPGRGYRFIAAVEVVSGAPAAIVPAPLVALPPVPPTEPMIQATTVRLENQAPTPTAAVSSSRSIAGSDTAPPSQPRIASRTRLVIGGLVLSAVAGFVTWNWPRVSTPLSRVTLAVLPFENLGSDPERQYLADGLTDETAASLAQIDPERLSVKGRTLRYKGTTKTAAEIGRELSVDYLVESSIRSEGGRLRVIARLIRVRDQELVWSRSYEREPTSLLGLQQELSTAIAEQVHLRLSPDRLNGLERRQTRNADAYDEYLSGRYLQSRRTPETNARALQHYERAITLDPDYALAWCGLAFTYAASAVNGDARPFDVWPQARNAAAQAVRANPNLPEAHLTAGYVNWLLGWDWRAAEAALQQGVSLDPGNAEANRLLGHVLSQMGRQGEAESAMRRARELDPLDALTHALSSQVSFQARDYSAAVKHAREAILLDSKLWIGYMQLGQAYAQMGESDLALEVLADAARFSGGNSKALSLRGYVLAKAGRANEAGAVLRKLEGLAHDRFVPPFAMALVHAGLGEPDAVFEWLNKAYAVRDVHLMYLTVDPKWDPYRADPRFQALLARCGFAGVAKTAPSSR